MRTIQLPDKRQLVGMERGGGLAAVRLPCTGPGADHRLGLSQGDQFPAVQQQ
jgi:hypothetical protein